MYDDDGGGVSEVAEAGAKLAAQADLINKQAAQIKSAATGLKASAGSGGFHIEPEAAATLIEACEDSIRQLNKLSTHVAQLREAPKLGKTPGAEVVSQFTLKVATDNEGIEPAIENLRSTLNDMRAAYKQASTNYTETNELVAQYFKDK